MDETNTEACRVRCYCGVTDRGVGSLWPSNVLVVSFLCRIEEGLNMTKQIAMRLSLKFEKYLDLTAIYFSANAAANAVSSGCCGLKSRTGLLPRNREREMI